MRAYFIGIAGKTMAPLAKAFKNLGWEISGSDHKAIYPPMSTYLIENKIPFVKGYAAKNVPSDANLVVVGRSALLIDPENPEYLQAKKLGLRIFSYPEILEKYLIKKNSVVVAGTWGKTTISAILAWILTQAKLKPSYMIGGIPFNLKDGVKIGDSLYSVVEGDEVPALQKKDSPKAMFYRPKYLILTATVYDHPEVFKDEEAYFKAFENLVRLLPFNGILVYNPQNVSPRVVEQFKGTKISYSQDDKKADYFVKEFFPANNFTRFTIGGKREIFLTTILLGKHNLENICAAVALSLELGISPSIIRKSIQSFRGVKTRLEFLGKMKGRFLYWDFAQHPGKIKETFAALRLNYPEGRIIAVFDPAMTGLKHKESLTWYPGVFDLADQVIVGKVGFLRDIQRNRRVTGKDIVEAISKTQKKVFYEPTDSKIIKYLLEKSKKNDVVVFMSSGGLRFAKLIETVLIIETLGFERVKFNVPLSSQTTFRIGGPAELFFEAKTEKEILKAVEIARKFKIPYFILSGGSNILVGDKGFRGIVIKVHPAVGGTKLKMQNLGSMFKIIVEAGMTLGELLSLCLKNSLSGLEFLAGIPGTVGGAVRGNAGVKREGIGERILRVKVLDNEGKLCWLNKEECGFAYRESRFKHRGEIILEVEFLLPKGSKKEIVERINDNLEKRADQPKEPSAGCIFVNPWPQSAGALIDQCGLKGFKIKDAQISEKHANFIVNLGKAKAKDVLALITMIKQKVKEKFDIDLKEEIVKIGEF